ncbi:hypothetical protein OQA88_13490 [Cercophora sp. LCS_1]
MASINKNARDDAVPTMSTSKRHTKRSSPVLMSQTPKQGPMANALTDEEKSECRNQLSEEFDKIEEDWYNEGIQRNIEGYFVPQLQQKYAYHDFIDELADDLHAQRHRRHLGIQKRVGLWEAATKAKGQKDRLQDELLRRDKDDAERKAIVAAHLKSVEKFRACERGWMNLRRAQLDEVGGNKKWYRFAGPNEDDAYDAVRRDKQRKDHAHRRANLHLAATVLAGFRIRPKFAAGFRLYFGVEGVKGSRLEYLKNIESGRIKGVIHKAYEVRLCSIN